MIDNFSREVVEQIGYYVYRLIDPRNGETFYVGKGKGNRVFQHVKDANKLVGKKENGIEEDAISLKINQINDINNSGLDVIHIIQRYGLDKETAFEVEAALIDCFSGLTNIQSGHASDRGVTNAETLEKELKYEEYKEPKDFKYLIIKINNSVLSSRNNNVYETVRGSWKIDVKKAENQGYKYCFAVFNGVVKGVYLINKWGDDPEGREGRFEFEGEPAKDEIWNEYVGKRIPQKYRKKGNASPVQYCPR